MCLSFRYWAPQILCYLLSHSQKLSFSASSTNSLMAFRHAAPVYPMTQSRPTVEDPTKPLHPTSTRHALAFQPAFPALFSQVGIFETFALLGSLHDTSSSLGDCELQHSTQCINDAIFTPPGNNYMSYYPQYDSKFQEFRKINHANALHHLYIGDLVDQNLVTGTFQWLAIVCSNVKITGDFKSFLSKVLITLPKLYS